MEYRQLATTDLTTSRIVLGTMTFGSQVDARTAASMVASARDAGVTMFDTSNNYNAGESERILGRCVAPFRDEVLISTKVGSPVGQDDTSLAGLSKASILASIDASLERLGTDHVDVYYFHRPDGSVPIELSMDAADEVIRSGRARYLGQSNFAAWQIAEMFGTAAQRGIATPSISQPQYNLLSRRIEAEYVACSKKLGLANITYNPLAGGLLTGKHALEQAPPPGSRFTKERYRERYWNARLFDAVGELAAAAQAAGLSLIELAYRWLLSRPIVDAVLMGASTLEQLETNLAAVDGPPLDEQTLDRCDQVWWELDGPAPHYNR